MKEKLYEIVRWAAVAAAVVLLILLAGGERESDAALDDVTAAVIAQLDTSNVQPADNQMIKRLYGLQPSDYEGICLYYPSSNMDAEELLIVKLQDAAQQQSVLDAVERRLQTQKNSFDGYGIEQFDLLENHSVIQAQGNYILFVVSSQSEAAKQAFLDAL